MPSEYITDDNAPFDVRVAWGKDQGVVQLATVCEQGSPSGAERVVTTVNEWLANAGEPLVDWEKLRSRVDNPPYFTGWHVSLGDRRQVNRLIRVLRRARNDSMGADE